MSDESMQDESAGATEVWYIVKQNKGQCTIMSANNVEPQTVSEPSLERWGPYGSQQEAIARRVGLIRAGKCQPV